jgi:hypothetical protein
MVARSFRVVFGLAALANFVAAGWLFFQSPGPEPAVWVEDAEREVAASTGEDGAVTFIMHNSSWRSARLVGASFC